MPRAYLANQYGLTVCLFKISTFQHHNVCISGTWLGNTILNSKLLVGYSVFRCDKDRAALGSATDGGILNILHIPNSCFTLSFPLTNLLRSSPPNKGSPVYFPYSPIPFIFSKLSEILKPCVLVKVHKVSQTLAPHFASREITSSDT